MFPSTTCITYNNPSHERFQNIFENLYAHNFTYYKGYKQNWIRETDFYKNNMQVFKYEKYAGYFLWKPFCIQCALDTFHTSYVLYCDSNVRFKDINKFSELFQDMISQNGFFFIKHKNYLNTDWTKRDTFILMDADNEEYWMSHQVWTSVMGFSQSPKSREFLNEYLFYCRDPRIVTELPNQLGENRHGFREHRWEQSVVSILAERYKVNSVYDEYTINFVDKVYDEELYRFKDDINKDPLKELK